MATGRPELRTILDFIHPGETLVVTRIDRLACSMRDLQVIVATLKDTEAPPRYTEAGVVRTLEEFGIGRPSTWAAARHGIAVPDAQGPES